jgi:hypothetical protein
MSEVQCLNVGYSEITQQLAGAQRTQDGFQSGDEGAQARGRAAQAAAVSVSVCIYKNGAG